MTKNKLRIANDLNDRIESTEKWLNIHGNTKNKILIPNLNLPFHVIEDIHTLVIRLIQEYQRELNDKLAEL